MSMTIRCRLSPGRAELETAVVARVQAALDRFEQHLRAVEVRIEDDGPESVARVTAQTRSGDRTRVRAAAGDPISAAHVAAQRVQRVMRRRRGRQLTMRLAA